MEFTVLKFYLERPVPTFTGNRKYEKLEWTTGQPVKPYWILVEMDGSKLRSTFLAMSEDTLVVPGSRAQAWKLATLVHKEGWQVDPLFNVAQLREQHGDRESEKWALSLYKDDHREMFKLTVQTAWHVDAIIPGGNHPVDNIPRAQDREKPGRTEDLTAMTKRQLISLICKERDKRRQESYGIERAVIT
jgi:hypothetical protein